MTTIGEGAPNGESANGKPSGTQIEKPTQPHVTTWIEAGCAVLIVIITGTYTYYAAGQLHKLKRSTDAAEKAANVADQTLKEIRAGSGDTHELAVQAKNQADRTKDIADRALAQANATNELARQAKRSADASKESIEQAKVAVAESKRQFLQDQRPYVWMYDFTDPDNVHIVEKERMSVNVPLVNYGKSPAVREVSVGKIFIGPDALQQADRWFSSLGSGPIPVQQKRETIIPPGIPTDYKKTLGYTSILTDSALTHEGVEFVLHTDEPVAMVMRIEYYDLSGNRYWSDACFSRYANGAFPHCPRHNEIH